MSETRETIEIPQALREADELTLEKGTGDYLFSLNLQPSFQHTIDEVDYKKAFVMTSMVLSVAKPKNMNRLIMGVTQEVSMLYRNVLYFAGGTDLDPDDGSHIHELLSEKRQPDGHWGNAIYKQYDFDFNVEEEVGKLLEFGKSLSDHKKAFKKAVTPYTDEQMDVMLREHPELVSYARACTL